MGIGILLKNLINEKGSNVNEVSTATGVSPSTLYSIIKRDSMSANIQDLYKVAQYLGVSLDYFYDGFETKEEPAASEGDRLSDAESAMLNLFRAIPPESQRMVLEMIEAALKSQGLL